MLDSYPPILTTEEVASILRLSERTVIKFAKDGTIPAMRVGGQFRFSRDRLVEWIDAQTRGHGFEDWEGMSGWHGGVAELLRPEFVLCDFSAANEEEAIKRLCDYACELGRAKDADALYQLVLQRERSWSTSMGHGVAFPHPRAVESSVVPEYVLLVAISPDGVSFKGGEDRVNIIAFFAIPSLQLHLKILASLGNIFSHEELRESVMRADKAEDVIKIISDYEERQDERDL